MVDRPMKAHLRPELLSAIAGGKTWPSDKTSSIPSQELQAASPQSPQQ